MIPYHGTPLTPEIAAAQVFAGRHCMVSFANPQQLPLVADVCQSFALDNGAFSAWRSGKPIEDWQPFYTWVKAWMLHPGFDWFLIPDVMDGSEQQNDALIAQCPLKHFGVPIWHLHESVQRLARLREQCFSRIAIGSSGEYASIGSNKWWARMAEAMEVACLPDGRPMTRLHGLRMLDPDIFTRFPFASADSTNAARNVGIDQAWKGTYQPPSKAARGITLAWRIEAQQSSSMWHGLPKQSEFWAIEPSVTDPSRGDNDGKQ